MFSTTSLLPSSSSVGRAVVAATAAAVVRTARRLLAGATDGNLRPRGVLPTTADILPTRMATMVEHGRARLSIAATGHLAPLGAVASPPFLVNRRVNCYHSMRARWRRL